MELAYAPPFGSAKDPVNLAGMAIQNVLPVDVQLAHWNEVASLNPPQTVLLDVPLDQIRSRMHMENCNNPKPVLRESL